MVGQLHHVAEAEIAERIHTDDFSDLLNRVVVGDELVFVVNIRAVVTFGHKGRRADPHVDLLRAGLAQQVDGAAAGGAPDDGVIDQHHALALHHGADGVQLDIDLIFPHILRGRNKGAADVFVLDKAHAVGDPGLPGVAHGGVQTGVRHADDDVRLHGMLQREERTGPLTGHMNAAAVDHGVGAGKVDELKNAQSPGRDAAVGSVGLDAVFVRHHDLSGQNIPLKAGAHGVQSAAFRGEHHAAVLQPPHAQGTEAVRVPDGDQLAGG